MSNKNQKTTHPGFSKNKKTGVVINNNNEELQQFLYARQRKKEIDELRKELNDVRQKLMTMANLIEEIQNKING